MLSKPEQLELNESNEDHVNASQVELSKLPDIISSHNSKAEKSDKNVDDGAIPYFCSIDPDEIPAIPDKRFLTRVNPEDDMKDRDKDAVDLKDDETQGSEGSKKEAKKKEWRIGPDGMKIKGRGTMRYNPLTDRGRSITPPHWKDNRFMNRRNTAQTSLTKENKGDLFSDNSYPDSKQNLGVKSKRNRSKSRSRDKDKERNKERNTRFDRFYRMKEEERLQSYSYRKSQRKPSEDEETGVGSKERKKNDSNYKVSSAIEQRLLETISKRVKTEMYEDTGQPEEGECLDPIPFRPRSPKRKKRERKNTEELKDQKHNDGFSPTESRSRQTGKSRGSKRSRSRSHPIKREASNDGAAISKSIEDSISERFKSIANYSFDDIMSSRNAKVEDKESRNRRKKQNSSEVSRNGRLSDRNSVKERTDVNEKREPSSSQESDQHRCHSQERRRNRSNSSKDHGKSRRSVSKSSNARRKSKSATDDNHEPRSWKTDTTNSRKHEKRRPENATHKSRDKTRSPSRDRKRVGTGKEAETKQRISRDDAKDSERRKSNERPSDRRRGSERSRSAGRNPLSGKDKDRTESNRGSRREDPKVKKSSGKNDSKKHSRNRRKSRSKSSSVEDLFNLSALV